MERSYEKLLDRIEDRGSRGDRMQAFVDLLWDGLRDTGVSWAGFYCHEGRDELVLGPHRDKSACSPIGLHGACGQAFRQREAIVIHDVADLGEAYIACDPRDRSEVVIPLLDDAGSCWGVLDLDSYEVGAFGDADVSGLQSLLRKSGLTQ